MRVCHLVTNPYSFDTRVKKQCESLVRLGCEVVVVAVHRKGFKPVERINGVRVIRVMPKGNMTRKIARVVYGGLKERHGGAWYWPHAVAAVRFMLRVARKLRAWLASFRRLVRRITGVLTGRQEPVDVGAELEDARRTEAGFSLWDHVRYWGWYVVAILAVPFALLLPVFAAVGFVLGLAWGVVRPVWCWISRTWNRLAKPVRKKTDKVFRKRVKPHLNRVARTISMLEAAFDADANVYQANDVDTLTAAGNAARLRRVDFVYDIHELYDESFPTRKSFRERYRLRMIERRMGGRARHRITVGENIARVMHERYGWDRPLVVYNAQRYEGSPEPDPYIRERIGDESFRKRVFVYAGRITRGRGLVQSVQAFSGIDPDRAALVIMGNAEPKFLENLHRLVDRLGLRDRVFLLDPVDADRLPAVLRCADVGLMLTEAVCLSYYYGLGNKMFHYVNAGIGVLAANHPEKRAFVEAHGVGECVEDIEPGAIRRAVQDLLDDPMRIERMKRSALEAAPRVSWQEEEKKYVSLYTRVYEDVLFDVRGVA